MLQFLLFQVDKLIYKVLIFHTHTKKHIANLFTGNYQASQIIPLRSEWGLTFVYLFVNFVYL